MRVVLSGRTELHDRLYAGAERFVAEIRSLAIDREDDRLWIEKVELLVDPPRARTNFDGPMEALSAVLEQLRADPASMQAVVDELGELKRKLPHELLHDPDGPRLDDPRWLCALLGQVEPLLLDRLLKSEVASKSHSASRV